MAPTQHPEILAVAVRTCRICGSAALPVVFDLGDHALSGRFPRAADPDVPRAPLQLIRCDGCGLVQLGHDIALTELYGREYGYRSGLNTTMAQHLAGIARQVEATVDLAPNDTVLDIASNDGTLLKSYRTEEINRVGIDPSVVQFGEHYPADILRTPKFFSAAAFRDISPTKTAKAITSIAMFYDLPSPGTFVGDVASVLDPDGIWILEQSDVGLMLEANAFDTICHEHLEYYAFRQIRSLLESHGLRVVSTQYNASNGGSARIVACHRRARYVTDTASVAAAEARERSLGVDQIGTYHRFAERAHATRRDLRQLLDRALADGQRIHVYGASTKGNTLLQFCGIDDSVVEAASERNPQKWGRRTPGTNIPIISEAESRSSAPEYLLVLPWHFRDEFVVREAPYIASGGKLIFPLPTLSVYPA